MLARITALTLVSLVALVASAAASATPVRAAKLSAPEEKWAKPVVAVWNVMNTGLMVVSKQTTANNALVPGTPANKKLVETLGNFVACTPIMAKVKAPPSARLRGFATSMKDACARLGTGAHGVANGVSTIYKKHNGKLAGLQIEAAFKEFAKGSTMLAKARRQLLAIGGKNIFAA